MQNSNLIGILGLVLWVLPNKHIPRMLIQSTTLDYVGQYIKY
jgi:hypothetical protein